MNVRLKEYSDRELLEGIIEYNTPHFLNNLL